MLSVIMLNVIMLIVFMLNAVMLSVFMLNVFYVECLLCCVSQISPLCPVPLC
jgi:hypothetical protein